MTPFAKENLKPRSFIGLAPEETRNGCTKTWTSLGPLGWYSPKLVLSHCLGPELMPKDVCTFSAVFYALQLCSLLSEIFSCPPGATKAKLFIWECEAQNLWNAVSSSNLPQFQPRHQKDSAFNKQLSLGTPLMTSARDASLHSFY